MKNINSKDYHKEVHVNNLEMKCVCDQTDQYRGN